MSYILDALRKSERQRQTGQVPTLPALASDPAPRRQPWLAVLVVALLLFNAVGLGYLWFKGSNKMPAATEQVPTTSALPQSTGPAAETKAPSTIAKGAPPKAAKAPVPQTKPQVPGPAHPAASGLASGPGFPAPPGRPGTAGLPKPSGGVPPGTPPSPLPVNPPAPLPAQALPAPPPLPSRGPAAERERPPMVAVPSPPMWPRERHADDDDSPRPARPGDPPLLRTMPADFRERVPALKINLYAYSEAPAERFAIIDMKKYRVGDRIPGGALLLEMRADSLVLDLDGTRFRIPRI